uniref:Uncharacterized protein n=1 Tax=Lotus japonicus TaxID=34305 RepID=I3T2V5_LOTJA|nr:unknown [Lotus japonicus]
MIGPWIREEEVESFKKLASFLRKELAGEDANGSGGGGRRSRGGRSSNRWRGFVSDDEESSVVMSVSPKT